MNDMLKRANLVRAELMDDVDTIQRVISVLPYEVKQYPASMQKEIGTSIVNRDEKAHNRSHRCSNVHKCQRDRSG